MKVNDFSRIIYIGQILPCPPQLLEKINRAALKFLWASRLERPPPGSIIRSVSAGWLAMIHIETFLDSLFSVTNRILLIRARYGRPFPPWVPAGLSHVGYSRSPFFGDQFM